MATTRRRKSLSLTEQLVDEPFRFNFYQAVRAIEYAANCQNHGNNAVSAPLSLKAPPSREFLRFTTQPKLSFSPADINTIKQASIAENSPLPNQPPSQLQWLMEVTFMGLGGSQGVMPFYFSEAILKQLKLKNTGLRDFFDIFNHRAITMFYKAWSKYQIGSSYETHKVRGQQEKDDITHALLSLIGLGQSTLQYRQPYGDESLIPLSGLLSRDTCTASGLAGMIKHLFDLSVEIKQFTGSYSELTDDIVTKLGSQNNALGYTTFLGSKCHHSAGKFTVAITPRNAEEHAALAPGAPLIRSLMSFIRTAAGPELEFDIEVTQTDEQIPCAQLLMSDTYQPTLGWNTLLGDSQSPATLSVRMSSEILPPDDTLPLAS